MFAIFQTRTAKVLWSGIVCLGFIVAGILIGKSYKEWQESPIATSVTIHPIDDLDFPVVSVCHPKDSSTALYHDLVNARISDEHKKALKESAFEIFMEGAHKKYVNKMLATSKIGNMDQVYQGFQSLPSRYNKVNGFEIKMWNRNGTITTPWYQEAFMEEYYKEDRDFHMVLELPGDINI